MRTYEEPKMYKCRIYISFFLIFFSSVLKAEPLDSADAIQKAIDNAKPGDSIVIKDGLYTDLQINFKAKGTEDKPIILRPQTPGGVIITGSAKPLITINGEYLVVDGLTFDQAWGGNTVVFSGARNCRLTNCD